MDIASRLLGLAIIASAFAWAAMGTGDVFLWIDVPAAMMVMMLIVGGLWASFRPIDILMAVATALTGDQRSGPRQPVYVAVFGRAHQYAWGAGIVTMLLGIVAMLQNASDPSLFGPGLAVAVLPVLYGGILGEFLFSPMQQMLMHPDAENDNQAADPPHGPARPALIALIVVSLVLTTGCVLVILSPWNAH